MMVCPSPNPTLQCVARCQLVGLYINIRDYIMKQCMNSQGYDGPDLVARGEGPDTVKVDTCILCEIRTPEGMYYPSSETSSAPRGEEDWYICDRCVDDMYPPKE